MTASSKQTALTACGGVELHLFFSGGLAALERCATAVDKLNVFPVPDGDTGTNLARTVGDAVRAARSSDDASSVAADLAAAALQHARGNSGTIFAQLCIGLARSIANAPRVGAREWASAWDLAATTARQSVTAPVEGTMLTVARDAADAASTAARTATELLAVWRAMADAADATVSRTPAMLPILAQANVVDAGALGLALFFRGALAAFTGEALPDPVAVMQPSEATRRVIKDASFPRYCTQFLLQATGADHRRLVSQFSRFGDSLDVVEPGMEGRATRIHVHTDDPDGVVAYAGTIGVVSGVKVEDMQRQRAMLLAGDDEPESIAMIAVADGDGMRRVLESLYGIKAVIGRLEELDGALAGAAKPAPGESHQTIMLLANSERVAAAAGGLDGVRRGDVVVVPTRNTPEGIAAALAFDTSVSPGENSRLMMHAARSVRVVCVAKHEATGRLEAVCDGETLATGTDIVETAQTALSRLSDDGSDGSRAIGLITIYSGAGVQGARVDELGADLERRFSRAETEIIAGGQSDCLLWITVESNVGPPRY